MDKNTRVYTVVHVSELGELDNGQREFNDKLNECIKFFGKQILRGYRGR